MSELQELIREVTEYQEELRRDGISEDKIGQMIAPHLRFIKDEYDAYKRLQQVLDGVEYGDELIPQQQQMQHLPLIDPYNGMTLEEVVNGDPEAAVEWLARDKVEEDAAAARWAVDNKAVEGNNASSPYNDGRGWVEHHDEVSGKPYWYHEATGGRKWVNPMWVKHHDDTGVPFWYHELTGESRWEDPTGGNGGAKKSRRKKSRRKKSRRKKSRRKKSRRKKSRRKKSRRKKSRRKKS